MNNIFLCTPIPKNELQLTQRGVRVAEGARLESVYTLKGIEGSNPSLSANKTNFITEVGFFILQLILIQKWKLFPNFFNQKTNF